MWNLHRNRVTYTHSGFSTWPDTPNISKCPWPIPTQPFHANMMNRPMSSCDSARRWCAAVNQSAVRALISDVHSRLPHTYSALPVDVWEPVTRRCFAPAAYVSGYRQVARCFVSLNVSLSHSRSFEMTPLSSSCVFHCNCISISYRFYNIHCQITAWPWNMC